MIKVNQVNNQNEIVEDYDSILNSTEIFLELKSHIPNLIKRKNCYYFSLDGAEYSVFIKNITYLGIPHPIYKKRIQISNDIKDLYKRNNRAGITTLILGVYSYCDQKIYCDFRTEDYIEKKANNSSAHVNIFDLKRAQKSGVFKRTDYFGNHIYLFSENEFPRYLNDLKSNKENLVESTIATIDGFMNSLKREWFGTESYDEMFSTDFADRKQGEWPGFFLEYMLLQYLKKNNEVLEYITYRKEKSEDEIDLDLYFPKLDIFGDLKMHSEHSSGILGNDRRVIQNAIFENGRIWYLICEHSTEKDSEHDYKVTEHWNQLCVKDSMRSYGEKMKYSVYLKKYYILEINEDNLEYVTRFNQGKNSNGKPREPKISINKNNIDMFLIYSSIFE